jgi:hypothetical protein
MKKLIALLFALPMLVALLAAPAAADVPAVDGQIPGSVLSQMGLGGMDLLSDEAGMDIRGKGYTNGGNNNLKKKKGGYVTIALNIAVVKVYNEATGRDSTATTTVNIRQSINIR